MTGEVKKKKPRVDRRKNVGKVAEILAKNPNKTEREIAKEAGVSNGTAHNAKQELEQSGAKDPTIAYIVGSSKDNLKDFSKINRAVFKKIVKDNLEEKNGEREMLEGKSIAVSTLVDLNKIATEDMKRVTVFGGAVTDPNGGLNNILTPKQLEAIDALKDFL